MGIVIGALFVVANNLQQGLPQLSYKSLYRKMVYPILISALLATLAALLSLVLPPYFAKGGESVLKDLRSFEMVAYIHWGTYIGGALGALLGAVLIRKERRQLKEALSPVLNK